MAVRDEGNYEVGYGRPPKQTRFKPGQSGNPNGRRKKVKGSGELLQEVLNSTVIITEKGVQRRVSHQMVVFKVLVANAMKGQARASAQLFKLMQTYGMLDRLPRELNEMVIKFVGANSEKEYASVEEMLVDEGRNVSKVR